MTTEQQTAADEAVQIIGGEPTRDTSNDRFPFRLGATDDTILIGTRPKMAIVLDMVDALYDESNQIEQAKALLGLLDEVLDEASCAHVRKRFKDKDDDLDLDHPDFLQMFQVLLGIWYPQARPTGGPRASSARSARTGKRSTARSPRKA